jgi:hypothetical protein
VLTSQKRKLYSLKTISNGIEMVCEIASEDSDWSVSFPHLPSGVAFERLKLSPLDAQTPRHSGFNSTHLLFTVTYGV